MSTLLFIRWLTPLLARARNARLGHGYPRLLGGFISQVGRPSRVWRHLVLYSFLTDLACLAQGTNPPPISLRYVTNGHFNNGGYLTSGTVFWATNQTSNRLIVTLSAVETKVGTNWISGPPQGQLLRFQPSGNPTAERFLQPNSAGYATIQLSNQPSGTMWRAKVTVQPVLTGLAELKARIIRYPDRLQYRIQTGNTNISISPFATNTFFFGNPTVVMSQEVLEE